MNTRLAAAQLSPFQLGMYREVVADHATTTEHSAHCCGIAKTYAEVLKAQDGQAATASSTPAKAPEAASLQDIGRAATPAQIRYVQGLLANRAITRVEMASWGMMLENGMTSFQASDIISRLKERPIADRSARMATPKQVQYVLDLLRLKQWDQPVDPDTLTFVEVGDLIDKLKAAPKKRDETSSEAAPAKVPTKAVGEGVYFLHGAYVKVQVSHYGENPGRLYTKVYNPAAGEWNRKPGLLGKLLPEHQLTEAQASRFGHLYGRCVKCSLVLTDEVSIERGYGPICADRMGF